MVATIRKGLVALACVVSAFHTGNAREREPVVGGPCEGCDAVFVGLPDTIESRTRIEPADQPGEPMVIDGIVRDRAGRPVPGVVVYVYHTNAGGRYPTDRQLRGTSAYRHGRLRGWAASDSEGRYSFETIRPGGYPLSRDPEHVHMHVIEPGRCTYYIDDLLFDDDERLTDDKRRRMVTGRGGAGVASPTKDEAGRWRVTRDIVLGANVPGYPGRD